LRYLRPHLCNHPPLFQRSATISARKKKERQRQRDRDRDRDRDRHDREGERQKHLDSQIDRQRSAAISATIHPSFSRGNRGSGKLPTNKKLTIPVLVKRGLEQNRLYIYGQIIPKNIVGQCTAVTEHDTVILSKYVHYASSNNNRAGRKP
jgi:Ni/Co efflux regulator RcnB